MDLCPKCKSLVYFNSYFGAYECDICGWKDDSYSKCRIEKHSSCEHKAVHSKSAKTETQIVD